MNNVKEFIGTKFKELKNKKNKIEEYNGIFVPSTLPGIGKSWWMKLRNPFVKTTSKIEMVNEAITAHEEQLKKAKAFVDEKPGTVYNDVVPFAKTSVDFLKDNLDRLKGMKTKLQGNHKFKEASGVKHPRYNLSIIEYNVLSRYLSDDAIKAIAKNKAENKLKNAGITIEQAEEPETVIQPISVAEINSNNNNELPKPDLNQEPVSGNDEFEHKLSSDVNTMLDGKQKDNNISDNNNTPDLAPFSVDSIKRKQAEILSDHAAAQRVPELEQKIKNLETSMGQMNELNDMFKELKGILYSDKTLPKTFQNVTEDIRKLISEFASKDKEVEDLRNQLNGKDVVFANKEKELADANRLLQAKEVEVTTAKNDKDSATTKYMKQLQEISDQLIPVNDMLKAMGISPIEISTTDKQK